MNKFVPINHCDLFVRLTDSQFTGYCSTPLLLILQPSLALISSSDVNAQALPFKAYEPTIELRDRKSRSVYIEVPYNVETGEAERIAVDWTARGGGSGTSCKPISSHCLAQIMLISCDSGIAFADATICCEDVTRTYSRSGQICNECDSRYGIFGIAFFFLNPIFYIRTSSSRPHYPALSVCSSRILASLREQALPGRI
jgi:hypothetical protein